MIYNLFKRLFGCARNSRQVVETESEVRIIATLEYLAQYGTFNSVHKMDRHVEQHIQ